MLWDQEYHAKGDLAFKIKMLAKPDLFTKGDLDFCFFNRYIDAIECASIVGFKMYNSLDEFNKALQALPEDSHPDAVAEVPIKTILKEQKKLKFLFRVIMLNENVRGLSLKEKVDNAFRNDSNPDLQEKNEELFNMFVRLGIDVLYERVVDAGNAEDCLDIMCEYLIN